MKTVLKRTVLATFIITSLNTAALSASLTTTTTDPTKPAFGNSNGGGGGAYQLPNGKVVTLPEFGILIRDNSKPVETTGKRYPKRMKPYQFSAAERKATGAIQSQVRRLVAGIDLDEVIPLSESPKVLDRRDVDPADYERIKSEYRLVLKAFGYKLDEEKFILPAYSEGEITYILPDFDKLDEHQRAKTMIHEKHMRTSEPARTPMDRVALLIRALKFDTVLESLLKAQSRADLDLNLIFRTLRPLELISDHGIFNTLVRSMLDELKRPIRLSEFVDEAMPFFNPVLLDPALIQETQDRYGLKGHYAEMFEGTKIRMASDLNSQNEAELLNYCNAHSEAGAEWQLISDVFGYDTLAGEFATAVICTPSRMGGWPRDGYILVVTQVGPYIEKFRHPEKNR